MFRHMFWISRRGSVLVAIYLPRTIVALSSCRARYFLLHLNLVIVLAIPLGLLRFVLYNFLQCGLCEQAYCHPWTSILFLQNTRQLLAISSCRMPMQFGSVDVAFNCSQSSNTIVKNTSPDHQSYLPFRARTNKVWVVLFVVFSPNVNIYMHVMVVCSEHNLTFI